MIERASSRSSIFFVQRTTTRANLHQSVARSCGSPVFVDHTAEQITTRHPYRELGPRDWPRPIWWDQPKRAMWPMLVVVRHIDTKDALQVTAADDQEVVETRKSQANVVAACWRKKTRHDKPLRSGAGGTLAPIRAEDERSHPHVAGVGVDEVSHVELPDRKLERLKPLRVAALHRHNASGTLLGRAPWRGWSPATA